MKINSKQRDKELIDISNAIFIVIDCVSFLHLCPDCVMYSCLRLTTHKHIGWQGSGCDG